MKIFDYKCPFCSHIWEAAENGTYEDPEERTCPKCYTPGEKMVPSVHAQFKGTGFHCNDYGKRGPR